MTVWLMVAAEANVVAILQSSNRFNGTFGSLNTNTNTGVATQARARAAYTLADLYTRIVDNNLDATSTIRSRRNLANGNQSVSVPANTSGVFEDTVNTDSIVDGDTFGFHIASGTGGGSDTMGVSVVSFTKENTVDELHLAGANGRWLINRSLTEFSPLMGRFDGGSSETNTAYRFRVAATLDRLRIGVDSNGIDNASTFRTRINGANGNQSVSIPGLTTGDFEDTTNSDSMVSGDNVNCSLVTGTSAKSFDELRSIIGHVRVDSVVRHLACTNVSTTDNNFDESHHVVVEDGLRGAGGPGSTTEADAQVEARTTFEAQNLFVNIVTNTLDVAMPVTFRVGGADSALTVSVTASTTGEFEDTVNVVSVVATDLINYLLDSNPATVGIYNVNQIGIEQRQPVGPQLLPEGLQATQPIMVMRRSRG